MSLIHWWPLNENNNLHDKINNTLLTNNSSAFTTTGKIGGAYYFNGSNNCKLHCPWPADIQGDTISVAFWIKLESNWSGWGQVFTIGKEGTDWKDIRFGIDIQSDRIVRFSISDGSNATSYNGPYNSAISIGVWYHIAAIYDNGLMRLYINGNPADQLHSYSITIAPNFSGTKINIGGNSSEAGECTINDVRIYNHALSKKEVQELSRALVFHYTFDGGLSEETTNLLPTSLQNKYVENAADAASYTVTSGLTASAYTLSANIKRHIGDQSPSPYVSLFVTYSDGTSENITTTTAVDGYNIRGTADGQFHYYKLTVFNTSKKAVTKVNGWILDRGSYTSGTPRYMTVQNAQLEAKDHATAFTSGTRVGQPKNNIGLVHNTMENQGVIFCKDAQRHSVGYFKDGGQQLIYTGLSGYESALTTSMWFKSSNKSPLDGYHILFSIDDGSVEISIPANGQLRYGGYPSSGSRVCNNHSVTVGGKSVNLIDGQWHLINTVFDGTGWLGYVDGEYQTKWSMTSNVKRVSGTLRIGKYTSAATYGATDAYMDDVRLYNTAFNASDIKQLYESSWAANKQGQVFSGTVNENQSKFQITRGGINNCNQVYESGVVPSGYLALDGIKMERVPWINTGVVFNNANTQIMVAADITPTATSGNNCLAGCGNSSWTGPVMFNFCGGKLEFGTNGYSTSSEAQGAYAANERLVVHAVIDYNSQKWFKNGVQIKNITSRTCPTTTAPLYIGTFKTPSSSVGNDNSFRGYIHYFEVKYGSIHKKFIPCKRLADSVLGMYEINEGIFYSPEGGTYTAGPQAVSQSRDGSLHCAEFNEI